MSYYRDFAVILALPLATLSSTPSAVSRGATGLPDRVPVTVVLADRLPVNDGLALVMRRHDQTPHDVIVLKRAVADGALLSSAVLTLLIAREVEGNTPRTSSMLRVQHVVVPQAWQASELRRADSVVARVRRAPPRQIAPIGFVSAVDIHLRRDALKGRLRAKPPA